MTARLKAPILYFSYLLITWSLYRHFFNLPESWDELVFKPLLWLVPIGIIVSKKERRGWSSLGFSRRNLIRNLFYGAFFSGLLLGEYYLIRGLVDHRWPQPASVGIAGIAGILLISLATGVVEEIAFRGYLMIRLQETTGKTLLANVVSSVLFTVIHLPIVLVTYQHNPLQQGIGLFLSLSLGLVGGLAFYQTQGIIAPIIAHSLWNFAISLLG